MTKLINFYDNLFSQYSQNPGPPTVSKNVGLS
jgi:hypothetical protein